MGLLVSFKALAEALMKWGEQRITDKDVSAVYAQLEDNLHVVAAGFAVYGIEIESVPFLCPPFATRTPSPLKLFHDLQRTLFCYRRSTKDPGGLFSGRCSARGPPTLRLRRAEIHYYLASGSARQGNYISEDHFRTETPVGPQRQILPRERIG